MSKAHKRGRHVDGASHDVPSRLAKRPQIEHPASPKTYYQTPPSVLPGVQDDIFMKESSSDVPKLSNIVCYGAVS